MLSEEEQKAIKARFDRRDDNTGAWEDFVAGVQHDVPRLLDALEQARTALEEAREALTRIAKYRSDEPDWNMVMVIAEDAINPVEIVLSRAALGKTT